MTEQEVQRLVMGESFVRHRDGSEGVYLGASLSWGPATPLLLHVVSRGVRYEWLAVDCERA